MVGYLGFDGFTSTWQDKMFKGYSMSIYNQILYVQLCSAGVSFFGLVSSMQVRSSPGTYSALLTYATVAVPFVCCCA
jgi:UAA transporter family